MNLQQIYLQKEKRRRIKYSLKDQAKKEKHITLTANYYVSVKAAILTLSIKKNSKKSKVTKVKSNKLDQLPKMDNR